MRILITGAAGFIGSNFVRRVNDHSLQGISSVIALDSLTYAGVIENLDGVARSENYTFVHGDIRDAELVSGLLKDVDAVINFAAESHVDRSIQSSSEFVSTNMAGVQVLLDEIKSSGRKIRFVQVSTDEVYGSIDEGSWDENCPLLPNSPYSASKAGSDLIALSYHATHGVPVVVTRCTNNFGPFQYPEKAIPLFTTNLLDGKKIPLYGDGLNERDWLYVDDHCTGVHLVSANLAGIHYYIQK